MKLIHVRTHIKMFAVTVVGFVPQDNLSLRIGDVFRRIAGIPVEIEC